jgi:hypothetical protein
MEPSSIILITAPILFPVAMKLGIDPIHFGVMMYGEHGNRHDHAAGGAEPVCGAAASPRWDSPSARRPVWPWLLTMLVYLMLITYCAGRLDLAAEDAGHDVAPCHACNGDKGPVTPGLCFCGTRLLQARRRLRRCRLAAESQETELKYQVSYLYPRQPRCERYPLAGCLIKT